ncbi:MAG: hypothetical protein GY700_01665 [Propionibacteriaceae bacterium]|nr:hypothetical protein [Propionibacteriaceae bacterium]
MYRRTSIELSEESYLDLPSRGYRSGYLRMAVDRRLHRVRTALLALRASRNDDEILALNDDASIPVARIGDTDFATLPAHDMESISLLWDEAEATGMTGIDLLIALDSGRLA